MAKKHGRAKISNKVYEAELFRLQTELVKLQEWAKASGARIVALPVPTGRQQSQWYFQRYIEHLPSAGNMVLFDRSWYNRAGVERAMGHCTPA